MEQRYLSVSKQLVELGYKYTLNPDSLLLVEKLLGDLIETTENLRKYMKIAQDAVEERDNLRFGAEPYKCDNAKLVKECNELHLAFLQIKESNEKQQKELTKKITVLEKEKRELQESQKKFRERVRELELESVRKTDRQFQQQLRQSSGQSKSTSVLTKNPKKEGPEVSSTMVLAEQKITNLMKEIGKLKDKQLELTESNCELKNKLNTREKEIQRLRTLLEGGRPIGALNSDCCYQDVNVRLQSKQDEINYLQKTKADLEHKLKEARCKQHEAMKNALSLAERNTILEKELRDIDEMALAVEQECNTTVKNNCQKVRRLQDRMQSTLLELQKLETEVASLRRDKKCLMGDLEAIKIEKRHLQTVLEKTMEDKKMLTDKINKFTIIERNLNNEIDRLVRNSAEQKRALAEMKGQIMTDRYEVPARDSDSIKSAIKQMERERDISKSHIERIEEERDSVKQRIKVPIKQMDKERKSIEEERDSVKQRIRPQENTSAQPNIPNKRSSELSARKPFKKASSVLDTNNRRNQELDSPDTEKTSYKTIQDVCNADKCMQRFKEIVGEEMSKRFPDKTDSLERVKNERDFYMKEYQALLEQCRDNLNKSDDCSSLQKKMNEKENLITELQYKNESLAKEKHSLMERLENVRDFNDDGDSISIKSTMKRLERERDLLKADVERMEDERDSMKQRIKVATELHSSEIERYQKTIADLEMQLSKYEKERHDLLQNQGSRRATITTLEDQCETLKEQLKSTQAELTHHRTIYSQLKTLHEQTDRALADSQGQLLQLEKELANYQQKNTLQSCNTNSLTKEIANLKNDLAVMKQTLSEVEMDNDGLLIKLDEKTERIASLELELQQKDCKMNQLEHNLCELKNKVSSAVEEKNTKECLLKNTSCEIQSLKNELQCALKAKESALCENRRLQDDLAACTSDARRANSELEIAKRQIEDLKRQLQHYCAEVKRIEDMMTQKEVERSEMLDQFRNLSHEAVTLENNNHSLEHEATQSKVQLSVALDHASDLERQLDEKKCTIKTYERQISEMNCQIANLEMQVKHYKMQVERAESDLAGVQDLCVKLDKQKEDLQRQLCEKESENMQVERDLQRIKRDSEALKKNVLKDQGTVENLERLLAENREQAVEQRLLNDDLQKEIVRLKSQIKDLECNLASTTERLDIYQEKALDYSQQNKQLRRDLANERFLQSKEEDFHKKCLLRSKIPSHDTVKCSCQCKNPSLSNSRCKSCKPPSPPKSCLNKNTADIWQADNFQYKQGINYNYCKSNNDSYNVSKLNSPNTSCCKESENLERYNKPCKESLAEAVNKIIEKNERKACVCNKENEAGLRSPARSGRYCFDSYSPKSDRSVNSRWE